MIDKLSGNYARGYINGIQKIIELYNIVCDDFRKHNKKLTEKLTKEFLKCCLMNRELIREFDDGFIRWNPYKKEFEFWREKWSKYQGFEYDEEEEENK